MGVNRFMKPLQGNYEKTYVSQYVPQPFELMQRAAETKQKHYDEIDAQLDKSEAFLGTLGTHTGKDTDEMGLYLEQYKNELSELHKGDLTLQEDKVRKLGRRLGEDYKTGALSKYVASGNIQQKLNTRLGEARDKKLGEGGHSQEKVALARAYENKWSKNGYGDDFDQNVTTAQGLTRGSADLEADAMTYAKEIESNQTAFAGRYVDTTDAIHKFLSGTDESVKFTDAQTMTAAALLNNSDDKEELTVRAKYAKAQETGEDLADVTVDGTDIMAEALKAANPAAAAKSFTKATRSTQFKNSTEFGGLSAQDSLNRMTLPVTGVAVGVDNSGNTAELNGSLAGAVTEVQGEAGKLGLSPDGTPMSIEAIREIANNPDKRAEILRNKGQHGLDTLDRLLTKEGNLVQRNQEANDTADSLFPNAAKIQAAIAPSLEVLGVTMEDAIFQASREGGIDQMSDPLGIIGKHTLAHQKASGSNNASVRDVRKWIYSEAERGNPEYVEVAEAIKKFEDFAGNYTDAIGKHKDAKDAYLKRTAQKVIKTQGGSNVVPAYKMDEKGHLVPDKKASDELTRTLKAFFKNDQNLAMFEVTGPGLDKSSNFGDIYNEVKDGLDDGETPSMSEPILSKSVNSNGKRFVAFNMEGKQYHAEISDTQLQGIGQGLDVPLQMEVGGETITTYPSQVDSYMHTLYTDGLKSRTLENGVIIDVPIDALRKSQQGSGTFYNNGTFKVQYPKDDGSGYRELSGEEAYKYLLTLTAYQELR